jgi:hypothetical protein
MSLEDILHYLKISRREKIDVLMAFTAVQNN